MGLFDFITKQPAKTTTSTTQSQQAVQGSTQAYPQDDSQNGRLVQSPFSDVKYPLPTLDSNQSQPVVQNQPYSQTNQQSVQDLSQQPYPQIQNNQSAYNQQTNPFGAYNNQAEQNNQQPEPLAFGAYDPNSQIQQENNNTQPESTTPELQPQEQSNDSSFIQYQPQFTSNTQPEVNLTESSNSSSEPINNLQDQNSEVNNLEETPQQNPLESTTVNQSEPELAQPEPQNLPVESNNLTVQEQNSTENATQPESPEDSSNQTPSETQTTPVEDTSKDTLVIGTEKDSSGNDTDNLTQSQAEDVNVTEVNNDLEPNVEKTEENNRNDNLTDTTTSTLELPNNSNNSDLDKEIFNNVEDAVKEEFEKDQNIDTTPATAENIGKNEEITEDKTIENEPEVQTTSMTSNLDKEEEKQAYEFKVFKNIGLVGLNVENPDQNMSEMLAEVVRLLAGSKVNFILDSGKNYGEVLLNKLVNYKDIKVKGAYLKPFYSDYSDEPKMKLNTENYSSALFSNFDHKAKYLIQSADIFIVPETKGLPNISLFFNLLTNAYLYLGQHKPIILLGENWNNVISSLTSVLKLSEAESSLLKVCKNAQEVLELLKQLDIEYSGKTKVSVNKVLDMRNESDESDFFVNNF